MTPLRPGGSRRWPRWSGWHPDRWCSRCLGQPEFAAYRGNGHEVDHQSAQDVAGAPAGGRPTRARELGGVVGENFPLTAVGHAPVARYPDPQPKWMPDHGHVGEAGDHRVTVDALATAAGAVTLTVVEQVAAPWYRSRGQRSVMVTRRRSCRRQQQQTMSGQAWRFPVCRAVPQTDFWAVKRQGSVWGPRMAGLSRHVGLPQRVGRRVATCWRIKTVSRRANAAPRQ